MLRYVLLSLAMFVLILSTVAPGLVQDVTESYGCEANSTGNPIGGGEGYTDIRNTGDFIVSDQDQLITALNEVQPGQVVFLPHGVEIDLTGQGTIAVPEGITVAGSRGHDGSPGARLFTNSFGTMLATGGDNVRLTGLRFGGAYSGTDRIAGMGSFLSANHYALQVDNCEISGFSNCGVSVGRGAMKTNIHHNYIHHCQRAGYGYGVSVVGGANVHVIANIFDYCRHHIASTGSPGTGYEAAWNLILENAIGSHFDMHGGRDRGDNTDIAGDWMHIHHNTFVGIRRNVGIRGTPCGGADIHNNWFPQAIEQAVSATGNTRVFNNVWGPDKTPQEHAVCFVEGKQVECQVQQCSYCQ
jgi:hypothetical protein